MAGIPVRHLGDYIREQRASSQISLRQLAALAGVSNPYLSQIERGLRKPSAEILQQIAKGLRISAEALYVQAGILDQRESSGVVDALLADEALNERQKQVLLEIYDSFRKENAALALSEAAATTLAEAEPGPGRRPAATPTPHPSPSPRSRAGPASSPPATPPRPDRPLSSPHPSAPPTHTPAQEALMSVTTDVKKTGDTLTGRFTIKNLPTVSLDEVKKPAFAVAGLADLVIEQVKDVPADVQAQVTTAQARLAEVPNVVKTLPTQVKELRGEVETRVAKAAEQAGELYASLAVRGERLVTAIRRQPATEAAIAEGKEAVKKAEAAATAARKSVKAGEKAVEDAAAKIG